jgi:hypothetical protein
MNNSYPIQINIRNTDPVLSFTSLVFFRIAQRRENARSSWVRPLIIQKEYYILSEQATKSHKLAVPGTRSLQPFKRIADSTVVIPRGRSVNKLREEIQKD